MTATPSPPPAGSVSGPPSDGPSAAQAVDLPEPVVGEAQAAAGDGATGPDTALDDAAGRDDAGSGGDTRPETSAPAGDAREDGTGRDVPGPGGDGRDVPGPGGTRRDGPAPDAAVSDGTAVLPRVPADETAVLPRIVLDPAGTPGPAPDATAVIPRVRDDGEAAPTAVIPRITVATGGGATGRGDRIRVRWTGTGSADVPAPHERPAIRMPVLGRAPWILLLSALGVVLVALSYVAGWTSQPFGPPLYWLGQGLCFAPVVAALVSRRLTGHAESALLTVGLAVNQYLIKWMYSPDQFRFPDELQHWTGTTILLDSGRLYQPNAALPVAVHFPGLEEMGAAVAALTGMSVTAAGLLVAGMVHLAFVAALYALVCRSGGSPATAGISCVIYATAMHYLFFDSMYIYQTIALPFLVMAVWATRTWRLGRRASLPYGIVGIASIAVVTVSHHVTAFVLVGVLSLIALGELCLRRGRRRWSGPVLAGCAATMVGLWIAFPARDVLRYFEQPATGLVESATALVTGSSSQDAPPAPGSPLWQLGVQAVGLSCLLVILLRATWTTWRSRSRDPWQWTLVVGGLLFYASAALRFVGAQGQELAGRASTFTYIPMAILAGVVVGEWRRSLRADDLPRLVRAIAPARSVLSHPMVAGTAMATVLMVGARLGGWPPDWGRLPGPLLVDAYGRGVDNQGVAAATWAGRYLPRDSRVACDFTGCSLASSYGRLDPVLYASRLITDPQWTLADEMLVHTQDVDLVWIDLRLSRHLPVTGSYFFGDPLAGRHQTPIAAEALGKFDALPGTDRLYDSGDVRLYDLGGQ